MLFRGKYSHIHTGLERLRSLGDCDKIISIKKSREGTPLTVTERRTHANRRSRIPIRCP